MRNMIRFSKILLATTALVAVGSLALRAQAQTLPTGGSVASGQVSIGTPSGGRMAITQGSQNAIVNWQGFSIGQGGRVDIMQPNSSAAMLNRVTGQAPSTIAGQLNANGRVYLVNPNGIAITNSGVVNTGSFVASTLGISDGDFLSGRLRFQGNGASAAVSNAGRIQAGPGGYAALLGGAVNNSGTISVPMGRIGLGSGERVTLDLSGDGFLQVAVPTAAGGDQALVSNSGRLSAPGGRVEIAAATAQSAARHAINMSGVVEANTVSGTAGSITFSGGPGGTVSVSGRVDASSATGRGGNVTMTGATIALRGAEVNASGATGGGRVRIGGDRLGQGDLPRAQRVSVDNASVIRADATTRGDGGDIVLWSEGRTDFAGSISARGGAEGGRGGEAEVSSRGVLNYTGFADLRAPLGAWGTLLLDPYNITISNGTQTNPGFTATTDDSVINAGTLVTALGAANVVVSTGTGGTQAGNITLAVPLTWSSAGNLTLQAAGAIALNGAVTATAGGLTLQAGGNISATEAISVGRFELLSGNWVQNTATLPGFAATDFRLTGGSFLRAAGGDGSAATPYRLTDVYGVQGMGSSSALLASSYRLANDIAAVGTSGWNGGAGFVPVGRFAARFTGSLDGAGNVITGLTINRQSTPDVGLVGYAGSGSSISNLGLVGGSVTGGNYVGGLVGWNNGGSITQAYATGAVTGQSHVGGLVGSNEAGSITQAYAIGAVAGSNYVGGLVGWNNGGSITQAYATGMVAGSNYVGGLVGSNEAGSITQAYAIGAVTGSGSFVGGLVGWNNGGSIADSYWDTQTTGRTTSVGGTGLTTAQARSQASYSGWDFGSVWYQAGDMRPILRSEAAAPVGGVIAIRNLNQLQLMGANLAGSYRLAGNIDASATNATDNSPGIWGSGGFVPVGTNAAGFAGSLDGAGYVIDNLTIKRRTTDFVGLIGYAGSGSSISNLGLVGGEVRGRNFVGGLVGVNAGTITRSYVTGAVTGDIRVGGLAGDNSTGGTIADAHATATVSGVLFVGGLVGLNFNDVMRSYATGSVTGSNSEIGGLVGRNVGIISQSYATGEVRGPSLVGGLVGRHEQGATITEAYATGAVTGSNSDIGGLVGYNLGSITQAYATGAVKGAFYVGGLVGQIGDGAVRQVYATGTVEGDSVVGGLAGYNQALVEDAYASGAVTGVGSVGGLVGWNNSGSISRSYWDIGTTLRSVGVGTGTSGTDATGLTTAQARSQGSYVGWDFGSVWYQAGDMRPILRSEAAAPVGGVIAIRNLNQLQLMGANLAGSYRLAGNIDASATTSSNAAGIWGNGGFVPVGTNPFESGVAFTGSLDGAGHVINGLTINRPNTDFVGLIGYADSGSSISNLGLVGGSVTGNAFVGGLVGQNGGTITQAYATGAVTGTTGNIGGLVGWNNNGGSITQAYATGTVMGEISVGGLVGINDGGSITQAYATGRVEGSGSFVGGLMGYNGGVVRQAYATGAVTGSGAVGGLVGFNFGTIEQAYATGVVTGGSNVGGLVGQNFGPGAVTQSYWNTDPNGALPGVGSGSSTGATGLTTAQMQDIASFATTYAGWDFATIWSPPNQVGQNNNSNTAYYPQLYGVGPVLPVAFAPSLSATSREYGDSNPTASFTVAGLRAGDSIGTQPSLTGLPGASADVGTYAVSASGGALNAPSGATYRLIYLPRSLTVTPRLITVTPDSGPSREYGDANPTLTYALSRTTAGASGAALVNGDTLGGALASAADGTSNVGNYAITQGNLAGSGNYTITFIGGQTMAVTPRLITVTADAQSRQYGDANPTLSFATARTGGGIGLVNDDRLDGALSTLATQTSNIGSYAITLGSLTGSNYALTYVGNNLTVTPRLITVRANDLARNYNSANPPLTYRITSGSLANGDSFAGNLSTNAELQSQAGSYAITRGSLALSANYAMSFLPGTLTVTQGSLTLSANYAMSLVPGTLPVRPTAVMSNGEFGSTLAAWMNENGQMFWMRRGNTQWPFSTTDMSFGTAFMNELLSSGGVNVR